MKKYRSLNCLIGKTNSKAKPPALFETERVVFLIQITALFHADSRRSFREGFPFRTINPFSWRHTSAAPSLEIDPILCFASPAVFAAISLFFRKVLLCKPRIRGPPRRIFCKANALCTPFNSNVCSLSHLWPPPFLVSFRLMNPYPRRSQSFDLSNPTPFRACFSRVPIWFRANFHRSNFQFPTLLRADPFEFPMQVRAIFSAQLCAFRLGFVHALLEFRCNFVHFLRRTGSKFRLCFVHCVAFFSFCKILPYLGTG